jgi:peptidoglycan/LPS O-acetylase OafA/YrhL
MDDRAYVGWMQATLGYAQAWSPAFALVKIVAMLAVLWAAIRLPAALPAAWCAALGALTYPLYLLHQNLGYALLHRLVEPLGGWLALTAVTLAMIALAWLISRHVEPAGRQLIVRMGDRLRSRRLASVQAAE